MKHILQLNSWEILYIRLGCNECENTWWDYEESTCTCDEVTE